jgi:hypothetical protein
MYSHAAFEEYPKTPVEKGGFGKRIGPPQQPEIPVSGGLRTARKQA